MRWTLIAFMAAAGGLPLAGCGEPPPSVQYEVISGGATDRFQQFMVIVRPDTTDEECQQVADYVFSKRLRGDARGTVAVFDDAQAARIFDFTRVPNPTDEQLALMESHLRCQITRNPAGNVRRSWQ